MPKELPIPSAHTISDEHHNGIRATQIGNGIVRLMMFLHDEDKTWIDWDYEQLDHLIDILINARDTAMRSGVT